MNTALIVVDVQNDFCEGGALAVQGGARVAAAISTYLAGRGRDRYALVVATRDWHAPLPDTNDGHFAAGSAPNFRTTWPVHCVAGTPGADYHGDLHLPAQTLHVVKGESRQDYSGFTGRIYAGPTTQTSLDGALRANLIDRVDIVGIATDYCVSATALGAAGAGYQARLLTDLCAGVDEATTRAALQHLTEAHVSMTTSKDV